MTSRHLVLLERGGVFHRFVPRYCNPATSVTAVIPRGGSWSYSYMTPTTPSNGIGNNRKFSSNRNNNNKETLMPGMRNQYGSLGEAFPPGSASTLVDPRPWQAAHDADVQRVTQKAMIYELIHQQTRTIEEVVPWFLENMPEAYFQQVPERYRMDHIKAIAAVKDANMDLYLNLKSHTPDGRTILTFIRPGTAPGTLYHMVEELPWKFNTEAPLSRLHVFSTKDNTMSLNMFVYGHRPQPQDNNKDMLQKMAAPILEYAARIQDGTVNDPFLKPSPLLESASLLEYLTKLRPTYISIGISHPSRFLMQRMLFDEVSNTEGTAVHIAPADQYNDPNHYWVDVAVANSMPQVALENLCRLLYCYDFDVTRARLDVVPDGDNGSVTILRTLISPANEDAIPEETWANLTLELKRAKWLDPETTALVFDKYPWLGMTRGEVLTAFVALMHPILAKINALAYSKANIMDRISHERFIGHAAAIADLFLDRFNPVNPLSNEDMEARIAEIRKTIEAEVEDTAACEILAKMFDVVRATLKTNVFMPNRYALGFRLDPAIMGDREERAREQPFGVVFIHGRRFNAFHTRFRDISRGGMRLVTPASSELHALESARHYDECYGLAFAQQLKNKDIPEGGSKAVVLIDATDMGETGKYFVMRKSVKAFTDSILDLIVQTDETKANIVDRWGRPEVLYLGPDEQVIPGDIEWVVKRAADRGYPTPAAFMSSKPRAGINHKQYGVTSEGVNVYLDTALKHVLGINPKKQSFTVKMTGGPDGDVGGNEIKILIREYGDNVKIVGIADHSGCAEDPDGLSHEELMRLFRSVKPIGEFDASKLGPKGVLHKVDTAAGVKARNSMHNRVVADAFIPCGGRPNTIDGSNWKQFLLPNGTPSAPLIVEGANLFVTGEARKALYDQAGVVIVKDSSANKGGVITSSYEICAAMLLTEEEFVSNKDQIVEEVLRKLRELAKFEAELLFRERDNYDGALPEISQVISNCINAATDALALALDSVSEEQRESMMPLFRAHLPPTIANLAFDRVYERVPDQYIKNAIASSLAAKMVYKEGTKFVGSLSEKKLAPIAMKYLEKEKEIATLLESLEDADMAVEDRDKIVQLLKAGGARTALGLHE